MKKRVMVDVRVVCDVPGYLYSVDPEKYAKQVEAWTKNFEAWLRDHRSQDGVGFSVERVYEEVCSFCGAPWEVDAEGPGCCGRAMDEWDTLQLEEILGDDL